jgi:hypothetical protein
MNPFEKAWLLLKDDEDKWYDDEWLERQKANNPHLTEEQILDAWIKFYMKDGGRHPAEIHRLSQNKKAEDAKFANAKTDYEYAAVEREAANRAAKERKEQAAWMAENEQQERAEDPYGQRWQFDAAFQQKNASEPMNIAMRLLKMTPEEMEAQGFRAAAEQMRQMQAQEQQVRQQGQDTAPKMTPQAQSYQEQLDAIRAKEEQERNILNLKREGKPRIGDYRQAVLEYYNTHGRFPKRTKKNVMRVVERLRARDD